MKPTTYLSVSAIVLGMLVAGPASAQTGAPATGAPAQSRSVDAGKIKDRLGEINVENRKEFRGELVRAQNPEGHTVLFIIGPENFEGDESPSGFSQDKVRGQLTQAAFTNIEFIDGTTAVRGELDDKAILALSAEQGWLGTGGQAQSSKPEIDRLKEHLDKIGMSDTSQLNGKVVQARSSTGQPLLVLVGPEDFDGDDSVSLSASDLSGMQQKGFREAKTVENISMVRGKLDDLHVIALSGSGLQSDMATGTVPGAGSSPGMGGVR